METPTNKQIKALDLKLRAALGMTAVLKDDEALAQLTHAVNGVILLIEEQRATIARLRHEAKGRDGK